jgi:LPXTG-motif cell wall-anchored protein
LLVLAVAFGLLAVAQPADAGDSYIFDCGFVLDPPVIPIDGTVHIIGSQFEPGSEVTFLIDGEFLGTATVDPDDIDGNIDVTFDLPPQFQTDGEFTITVECPSGRVASNVLIVGQGIVTTTTTTALPVTGSSHNVDFLRLGIGLVVVGGLVLLLSRRRATNHTATPVG